MSERKNIELINRKLDRILQGLPPGSGKLTIEERHVLVLAKHTMDIDLSQQSNIQEKLRQHLEELAVLRLPRTSTHSLNLLFKPGRLSWLGLVVLVQLVLGSVFGNMTEYPRTAPSLRSMGCITPPASSFLTQSPESAKSWRIVQYSIESETGFAPENPRPVPTPLAPPTQTVFPNAITLSLPTPLQVKNAVEP